MLRPLPSRRFALMPTIFLLVGLASSLTAQTSTGAAESGGLRDEATTGDLVIQGAADAREAGYWQFPRIA